MLDLTSETLFGLYQSKLDWINRRLEPKTLEFYKETAESWKHAKEIVFDADFVERDCGALEGEVWSPELDLDDPKYQMETITEMCDRAKRALDKYRFAEDETIMIVAHGAILMAVRTVLSDNKIDYYDRNDPVIQGNILCCEKEEGKDAVFFNVF